MSEWNEKTRERLSTLAAYLKALGNPEDEQYSRDIRAALARIDELEPLLPALKEMVALIDNLWEAVPWANTFNLNVKLLNEAPLNARAAIATADHAPVVLDVHGAEVGAP